MPLPEGLYNFRDKPFIFCLRADTRVPVPGGSHQLKHPSSVSSMSYPCLSSYLLTLSSEPFLVSNRHMVSQVHCNPLLFQVMPFLIIARITNPIHFMFQKNVKHSCFLAVFLPNVCAIPDITVLFPLNLSDKDESMRSSHHFET